MVAIRCKHGCHIPVSQKVEVHCVLHNCELEVMKQKVADYASENLGVEVLPDGMLQTLPSISRVAEDNSHGSEWKFLYGGHQVGSSEYDKYFARFESKEGYWADYFFLLNHWTLGAN